MHWQHNPRYLTLYTSADVVIENGSIILPPLFNKGCNLLTAHVQSREMYERELLQHWTSPCNTASDGIVSELWDE